MRAVWFTSYSPTHAQMYQKHFRTSWLACGLAEYFEFRVHWIDEYVGSFGEKSFNDWGTRSMRYCLEQIKPLMGNIVMMSGVDYHFYQPIGRELITLISEHEFVSANDVYFECCGDFIGFIVTPRIIELYEWMIAHDHEHANQEFTMNTGLQRLGIDVHSLPREYWTAGMMNGREWNQGDVLTPPKNIKAHHANFTRGAENKLCLLNEVESIIRGVNDCSDSDAGVYGG